MKLIPLIIIVAFACVSCTKSELDFHFLMTQEEKLLQQVQSLVDSMRTSKSTRQFQADEIKWWNLYSSGKTEGRAAIIDKNIHLHQIKQLQNISIQQLSVSGDTIKGLIAVDKFIYPDNKTGFNESTFCMDTNYIELIIQQGKIGEILNYAQNPKKKGLVSIECFYFDEGAVNRFFDLTKEQIDSIAEHHNDYELLSIPGN